MFLTLERLSFRENDSGPKLFQIRKVPGYARVLHMGELYDCCYPESRHESASGFHSEVRSPEIFAFPLFPNFT